MHWLLSGPLSVQKLTVKIADLPASLQGKKLVQLSDFHYDGLRLSEAMLEKAIAVSNQAEPDLVLLTGDYVTASPEPIHTLRNGLKTSKVVLVFMLYSVTMTSVTDTQK
jgi:predicted MPP superfamily phosphohydrolase